MNLLKQKLPVKCEHTILCECERQRCPGRTMNIYTYVRRIQSA